MCQPPGFAEDENKVCKLMKSIYGLKQSPRTWFNTLKHSLLDSKFTQSQKDATVFFKIEGVDSIYILIYVDDILVVASSEDVVKQTVALLLTKFNMKDLGTVDFFLGMEVQVKDDSISLCQTAYIEKLLRKYKMVECNVKQTPMNKLVVLKAGEQVDDRNYKQAIGSLIYLVVSTRPDIAFAVSQLAKYASCPDSTHWTAFKHLLAYLKNTIHYKITYYTNDITNIVGYADASFACDPNDRTSISGYVFIINGGPVSWFSRKQGLTALSTVEAEYIALGEGIKENLFIQHLLTELQIKHQHKMLCDNQGAIAIARNPEKFSRTKHIEIKYHFLRQHVASGQIKLNYCPTEEMIADMF